MYRFQKIFLAILLIGININFSVKASISALPNNELYTTRNFINAKAETVSIRVNYPYPATEENTYSISPVNPLVEFRDAIKNIREKGVPAKIIFKNDEYNFTEAGNNAFLSIHDIDNLLIEGNGAKLYFHNVKPFFYISNSSRISIQNFEMKSKIRVASKGKIQYIDNKKSIVVDSAYAQDIKTTPWYKRVTTVFQAAPNARGAFQFKYGMKKYFLDGKSNPTGFFQFDENKNAYVPNNPNLLSKFDIGEPVIIKHSEYEAAAISGRNVNNISIRNNKLSNVHGMAIYLLKGKSGAFIERNTIQVDENDPLSIVASSADGIHVNCIARNVIVEKNKVSTTGDDALNIHGKFWEIVDIDSTKKTIKLKLGFKNNLIYESFENEYLRFYKKDLSLIGNARTKSSKELDENILEITLDKSVDLNVGDIVHRSYWQPKKVYVAYNRFHNLWGRGALLQCFNGIFTNNFIHNTSGAGIELRSDSNFFMEGGPVSNMKISNNILNHNAHADYAPFSNSYYSTSVGAISMFAKTARINGTTISPNQYFHGPNIIFYRNKVSNCPGPAFMVSSAYHVRVLRNTISNANYTPQAHSRSGMYNGIFTQDQEIYTKNIIDFGSYFNE